MSEEKRQQLTRRDFLTIAGGVTGSVLLAACAPGVTKVVEKVVTPTSGAKKPVSLKLWVTDRSTINNMTKNFMIPDFMGRNPQITVQCEFMPEQDLMTKLNTTAAAATTTQRLPRAPDSSGARFIAAPRSQIRK